MKKMFPVSGGKRLAVSLTALSLLVAAPAVVAKEKEAKEAKEAKQPAAAAKAGGPPAIVVRLKPVIVKEMVGYRVATEKILQGIVTGDHALVAAQAQEFHNGPMKKVSAQDKQELAQALPPDFFKINGSLREAATKLTEAAQKQDLKAELAAYSQVVETCQSCHAGFAQKRFPGFKAQAAASETEQPKP